MLDLLNQPLRASPLTALSLAVVALSGCHSSTDLARLASAVQTSNSAPLVSNAPAALNAEPSTAVRHGRYTLTNTAPRPEQLDLLSQMVDIQIPQNLTPSVQNTLNHVLRYSGYSLCPATSELRQLYAHTLPASHYRLGPITLRNALVTLAGPAWQPTVDEKARSICFVPRIPPAIPARLLSHPERPLAEAKP